MLFLPLGAFNILVNYLKRVPLMLLEYAFIQEYQWQTLSNYSLYVQHIMI